MKTHYLLFSAILLFASCGESEAQTTQMIGSTEVVIDTLNAEMNVPWEMQLEGSDYLWVTERVGYVSRVELATGEKTVVLNLTSEVLASGESGLLGMALHPNFPQTPEVFLVYTHGPEDGDGYFFEKLVKYTWNGTQLVNEEDLIPGIRAWDAHNGSRLLFLPDGTLLMSTGEQYIDDDAQDPESLSGKYLRLNPDGSIPADNPDPTSYVYTLGHRNSQGIVRLPSGKLIISEHGPSTDDEISILEAGKNYGWPLIHGFCDQGFENAPCATGLYTEPIHAWSPTIATSDLVYYQNASFPEWNNRLLMTTLNGKKLVAMQLNPGETDVIDEDVYFENQFGRLRDIAIGPDNEIYIATNNGSPGQQPIIRITPPDFTGLNDASQQSFYIYPTAFTNELTIQHTNATASLIITDMNGKRVWEDLEVASGDVIHPKVAPGVYYATLLDATHLIGRQRIVRQ